MSIEMKFDHFALIQTGHTVFGVGKTADEARENAREWMDRDPALVQEYPDVITMLHRTVYGDLAIIPCTAEFAAWVAANGATEWAETPGGIGLQTEINTYRVSEEFVTPPEKQGQIVTLSYAYDAEAGVIIERTHDASDGTVRFDAYADPDDGSDWAPWNGTPSLGEYLGECNVTMEDVS